MSLSIIAKTSVSDLGNLPFFMLGAYLLMLISVGIYGYIKSKKTEEDYYLAGRQQGFIVTFLTIMAAFFSSSAMLGIPGAIYRDGVAFMPFTLNLAVGGCAIYLLGSRISRIGRVKGYVTPGDMLCDYYDGSTAIRILVALLGFLYVVPYVVIQIRAGGHLAEQVFSARPFVSIFGCQFAMFNVGATVLTGVMMLYILVGGMRSVAIADVIQGGMLLAGMLIAGFATIFVFGGVGKYFGAISKLPREALSLPGPAGRYTPWMLMTICIFASLASLIQPAQWMRMYAAKSAKALKRSAIIFSVILPICFLFGVMVVGLGARALYPPTVTTDRVSGQVTITAHPEVGSHDQALVALLKNEGPKALGPASGIIVMVIMMAILAASMSTADANLHALSAVLTRDIYYRLIRPSSGEKERMWAGRGVIATGALLALWLVYVGQKNEDFAPLKMIVEMQFVAMGFSCQVLPLVIDMLFIRRGTRAGAVCGMTVGLIVVMMFTPLPRVLLGHGTGASIANTAGYLKTLFDIGFCGFVANASVFVLVSMFTKKPNPERVAEFEEIMLKKEISD